MNLSCNFTTQFLTHGSGWERSAGDKSLRGISSANDNKIVSFGVDRVIIIGQIRLLVGDKEKGTRRKTKTILGDILQSVRVAVINLLFGKDFFFLSHRYTGLD